MQLYGHFKYLNDDCFAQSINKLLCFLCQGTENKLNMVFLRLLNTTNTKKVFGIHFFKS